MPDDFKSNSAGNTAAKKSSTFFFAPTATDDSKLTPSVEQKNEAFDELVNEAFDRAVEQVGIQSENEGLREDTQRRMLLTAAWTNLFRLAKKPYAGFHGIDCESPELRNAGIYSIWKVHCVMNRNKFLETDPRNDTAASTAAALPTPAP